MRRGSLRTQIKAQLRQDIGRLAKIDIIKNISKQISSYEGKVKTLVGELNLTGRDAKEKGRQQLDKFAAELKRTSADIEKRVIIIFNQEAIRLNRGYNDLVKYLKTLANNEQVKKTSAKPKRKATKAQGAGKKTTSKKRAPSASKTKRKKTLKVKSKIASVPEGVVALPPSATREGESLPSS